MIRLATTLAHGVCMELHLRHCVLYCCMNIVNAGEMPMTHVTVHSRHHGWEGDSGYSGSSTVSTDSGDRVLSTVSTDSGYRGSSTASTSAHSTSHLIDHYQKMTVQPHDEGEL